MRSRSEYASCAGSVIQNFSEQRKACFARLTVVVPAPLQSHLASAPVYVSDGSTPAPNGIDPADLRHAIHEGSEQRAAFSCSIASRSCCWALRCVAGLYKKQHSERTALSMQR